jgi:hypothetical protein
MKEPRRKKVSQRQSVKLSQRWESVATTRHKYLFCVDAKVEIKPYAEEVDAIRMN